MSSIFLLRAPNGQKSTLRMELLLSSRRSFCLSPT
uniref:Uncharacterized protein n=1 Tax=Arundo donax TaxID=35708 RepID=A0A0A9BSS8_ARUDO